MKKNNRKDKRQLKRVRFERDIDVVGGKKGRSTRLGIGGLFLITDVEIPVGEDITLRFKLSDDDPMLITAKGVVVYTQPGKGMGIEFKKLPWDALEKISEFIEDTPDDS